MMVLPAQVTVTKFGFKGSQGLWEDSDRFEDELTALVIQTLSHHSAKVMPARESSASPVGISGILADLQRKYDVIEVQMARAPGGVYKGRFTLGDLVAGYRPAVSADTLVFIRGTGTMAVPFSLTKHTKFEGRVGFVDARGGEVLAFLEFGCDAHSWWKTADSLEPHLSDLMKGVPPTLYSLLGSDGAQSCSP